MVVVLLATLAAGCAPAPPPATASGSPFHSERKQWVHLSPVMREHIDRAVGGMEGPWLVILHSTGSEGGSVAALEDYHRRVKGDPLGIPYPFLVGNGRGMADGRIHLSARLDTFRDEVAKAGATPQAALAIGLVGDGNRAPPTPAQLAATDEILDYLAAKAGRLRVRLHRETGESPRACPGKLFPVKELRQAYPD